MAKHWTNGERRRLLKNVQSLNVVASDTTARAAQEERIRNRLKARREIEKIVESGVKRGDSLDKIYRYCSVLKKKLGYDPKNHIKKLYDDYKEEKNDGHEDR